MVVPADWREVRLGDLGSTFGGLTGKASRDFGDGNSSFVTFMNVMSNVVLNRQGIEKVRISNGERQSQVLEGDVIFNGSSETPEEVGFGSAVPAELTGLYLNSFCFGFRRKDLKSLDSKFFAYLTRSPLGRDIIRPMAQGSTRYNIAKTNLMNGRFPLPPLKEQEAIAEALSDADVAIESLDALIAKKRDVKQAAMQQLLTGRTRLPGFTADWKEIKVADVIVDSFSGPSPTCLERNIQGEEWGVFKTTCSTLEQGWDYTKHKVLPRAFWGMTRSLIEVGDTVITKAGPRHRVGVASYVNRTLDRLIVSGKMIGLRPNKTVVCPPFLALALSSKPTQEFLNQRTTGMAESQVNFENVALLETPMYLPPLKEQEAIAEALSVMDDELKALTEQVSKLRMVKDGMMQDLLTGKVRLV